MNTIALWVGNASLIAAAPDLLAALVEMTDQYRLLLQETMAPQHQQFIESSPTMSAAIAAINKATKET